MQWYIQYIRTYVRYVRLRYLHYITLHLHLHYIHIESYYITWYIHIIYLLYILYDIRFVIFSTAHHFKLRGTFQSSFSPASQGRTGWRVGLCFCWWSTDVDKICRFKTFSKEKMLRSHGKSPFLIGKPSISMGHLYHGYVSHNQRVMKDSWKMTSKLGEFPLRVSRVLTKPLEIWLPSNAVDSTWMWWIFHQIKPVIVSEFSWTKTYKIIEKRSAK